MKTKSLESYSTYENFYATCPFCFSKNTYNRKTDLGTLECNACHEVECLKCRKKFLINEDLISNSYMKMLDECYDLIEKKEYASTILKITQSYEVFFKHFLNTQLLYKSYATEHKHNINTFNNLYKELSDKIKKWTFFKMRECFLNIIYRDIFPSNLEESKLLIEQIESSEFKEINERIKDEKLRDLIDKISKTKVNELRNVVGHKDAYCPSEDEARFYYKEALIILHGFEALFDLKGDANYYLNTPIK